MKFKIGDIINHKNLGLEKIIGIAEYGKDIIRVFFNERSAKKLIKTLDDLLVIKEEHKIYYHAEAQKLKTQISSFSKLNDKMQHFLEFDNNFDKYCEEKQNKVKLLSHLLEDDYLRLSDLQTLKKAIEQNFPNKRRYLDVIQSYLKEYLDTEIIGELQTINGCLKFFNKRYKEREKKLYKDVFSIEGYTLDDDQQEAVVTDEQSCLVIAGAGCGKTSMLISKVAYLLKKGISPEKILLLSFTRKTVYDLEKRLQKLDSRLKACTFHKLGKDITGKEYNETITVKNTIRTILSDDGFTQLRKDILDYIAYYAQYFDLETEYSENKISIAEYEQLKYATLRQKIQILTKKNETLKMEKVKSPAEIEIANFLFLQGVDYIYEKEYPHPFYDEKGMAKKYRPDFYIKTPTGEIWLEHFGVKIDSSGMYHARWCSEEEKYIQHIYDKRSMHQRYGTILVETNETMHEKGELLTELKSILQAHGIVLKPISDKQISEYLQKMINEYRFLTFAEYVGRFISVYKSQTKFHSLKVLKEFIQQNDPMFQNKTLLEKTISQLFNKTGKFFDVVSEIYNQYQQRLEDDDSIDFNDMITMAIQNIKNGTYKCDFDYVIVDEFQDITQKRSDFLKTIQNQTNAKLFCVGDDWQSIYGFAGSDVSLFKKFDFAFPAEPLFIRNTHRNSQELVNIAGNFIMKNPSQIQKTLNAGSNHCFLPVQYAYYGYKREDSCKKRIDALVYTLDHIVKEHETSKLTVCLLGRYNLDLYDFNDHGFIPDKNKKTKYGLYKQNAVNGITSIVYEKYPDMKLYFTTIHKSKGAEYDYTIIIDLEESADKLSFPCQIKDDYMISPMLFCSDDFIYAEERRIFYVALTRCKKQCYLLVSEYLPSRFFTEIKEDIKQINETTLQYCERTGNKICPKCQEGILVWRENKQNGTRFLGCSRYPRCDHTQPNFHV